MCIARHSSVNETTGFCHLTNMIQHLHERNISKKQVHSTKELLRRSGALCSYRTRWRENYFHNATNADAR